MSFSSDVKNEIITQQYKNACCRHALLYGAIVAKGVFGEGNLIECRVENEASAAFLRSYACDFDKDATVRTSAQGGRGRLLSFCSPSVKKHVAELEAQDFSKIFKCPFCTVAFYRGVFLASGRVTDPQKQFYLEFSANNRTDTLKNLLLDVGISLGTNVRRGETLLYSKNSGVIEDFFSLTQLNSILFEIVNIKIENEFKNHANRLRNIDTVNITKAVAAADAQLSVIRRLEERNLLSSLPPELEVTARMRLMHPDMSLSQLSINSVPPVSKSGLSHRLARIMKLGEEILSKV